MSKVGEEEENETLRDIYNHLRTKDYGIGYVFLFFVF
jgi:hypothetical protein